MVEELYRHDGYLQRCEATVTGVSEAGIELDRTVFYAEGGGQPGDSGTLRTADGRAVPIVNTVKAPDGAGQLHVPAPEAPALSVGDQVSAEIDWERRHRLMRMHTALHLLCSLVEGEVTGGQVGDGTGRMDFNVPTGSLDKEQLSEALNRLVGENHPTRATWIATEELAARPDLVRTMSVKPPLEGGQVRLMEVEGVDLQACGGTHVRSTGEIGAVQVRKIENKGRQNRRVQLLLAD